VPMQEGEEMQSNEAQRLSTWLQNPNWLTNQTTRKWTVSTRCPKEQVDTLWALTIEIPPLEPLSESARREDKTNDALIRRDSSLIIQEIKKCVTKSHDKLTAIPLPLLFTFDLQHTNRC
jgi:hypothetical protein